jgi:hypothetical protein
MSEKPTAALDAVKIQARVVIPIVRALERELGEERAHSIVGRAIAESYAEWQVKTVSPQHSDPKDVDIEGHWPIETEVVEDTDSTFAINMTRCRFGRRGATHLRGRPRSRGRASPRLGVSPLPNAYGRREPL